MKLTVYSFSFRDGGVPDDADFVQDCRRMHNPHHDPELRPLDGRDARVQAFVRQDGKFKPMFDHAVEAATYGEKIAFGCFGGKHRSVAMAELVAEELRHQGHHVDVQHWALQD